MPAIRPTAAATPVQIPNNGRALRAATALCKLRLARPLSRANRTRVDIIRQPLHRDGEQIAECGNIVQLAFELHCLDRRVHWKRVTQRRNSRVEWRRILLALGTVHARRQFDRNGVRTTATGRVDPRQIRMALPAHRHCGAAAGNAAKHAAVWHHCRDRATSDPGEQVQCCYCGLHFHASIFGLPGPWHQILIGAFCRQTVVTYGDSGAIHDS